MMTYPVEGAAAEAADPNENPAEGAAELLLASPNENPPGLEFSVFLDPKEKRPAEAVGALPVEDEREDTGKPGRRKAGPGT